MAIPTLKSAASDGVHVPASTVRLPFLSTADVGHCDRGLGGPVLRINGAVPSILPGTRGVGGVATS